MDSHTILGFLNQIGGGDEQVIEIRCQFAMPMRRSSNGPDLQQSSHGLRFNNPDPVDLRQGDQRHSEQNVCDHNQRNCDSWPKLGVLASGSPCEEFKRATQRFFSVVACFEELRKVVGVQRWADVPKTLHNVSAVAKYLYMKPSINRLFDSVVDVQTVVESCWSSL